MDADYQHYGKFFVIQTRNCDLCVCPINDDEGCSIVLSKREEKNKKQEWYWEASSQTIRCKASKHKCLTIEDDGTFCFCTFQTAKKDAQRMFIVNENIEVEKKSGQVMVCQEVKPGEKVCLGDKSKHCWTFKYITANENLFFLKNRNLVLKAGGKESGTLVKLGPQEDMKSGNKYHQLWYEDKNGGIHNASNHCRLEVSSRDSGYNVLLKDVKFYLEETKPVITGIHVSSVYKDKIIGREDTNLETVEGRLEVPPGNQMETDSGNTVLKKVQKPNILKIYGNNVYMEDLYGRKDICLEVVGEERVEMRNTHHNLPVQQWEQIYY